MLNPGYAHTRYFLPNGLPLIESLANLERLPTRCYFIALPLKIKGGSGSPIRPNRPWPPGLLMMPTCRQRRRAGTGPAPTCVASHSAALTS